MGINTMLFSIIALFFFASPAFSQFSQFFPFPQFPAPIQTFPWRPMIGGPDSLPPWLRPQQENGDSEPLVGGPDSLPPWLRPASTATTTASTETESTTSPAVAAARFIDNTDGSTAPIETEDVTANEKHSSLSGYGYGYGGYTSPYNGYGSYGSYGYPYTSTGYGNYGGYTGFAGGYSGYPSVSGGYLVPYYG